MAEPDTKPSWKVSEPCPGLAPSSRDDAGDDARAARDDDPPPTLPAPSTGMRLPGPGDPAALEPSRPGSGTCGAVVVRPDGLPESDPDQLLTFLLPETVSGAVTESAWTIRDEIQTLVSIAKTALRPSDRIAAIRELRKRVLDSLQASGRLVPSQERRTVQGSDEDGHTVQYTVQTARVLRLARVSRDEAARALMAPVAGAGDQAHDIPTREADNLPTLEGELIHEDTNAQAVPGPATAEARPENHVGP